MTDNIYLLHKLIAFGFTENEARIYLKLLEHGKELGGTKIALITNIHRQYVYLSLPKLLAQGLIEEVHHGKQSRYKARPPQALELVGRKKAIEAGDLARELHQISTVGNEQDFEVIQGVRAIQEYELLHAQHVEKDEEECIIGGASDAFGVLMGDTLSEYLEIKEKKGVYVKYLGTEDEREFYTREYVGKFPNQKYRFLKNLPKGKTHMLVRKSTVSFYSFLTPPLVYVIKSSQVADNYRAFFTMLWDMGKE